MRSLALYLHTIRYLRPVQLMARARMRLWRPGPRVAPPPALRSAVHPFAPNARRTPTLIAPDVFRFQNVERTCGLSRGWGPADVTRLWLYHLHYFDDLNAEGAGDRKVWHEQLLLDWIRQNPPGSGVGWEPYPTSRRIVNWIKWALSGNNLPPPCHDSLAIQVRWLIGRLEYHLLGNHLLANAKALVYAGLYFYGGEAEDWLADGLRILSREFAEQVHRDGGHFELSPMYHAAVLEDVLDLINVMQVYGRDVPAEWIALAARMHRWLQTMSHPDGEIAFFNDAAFGEAGTAAELSAYASRLGLPSPLLAPAELVVLRDSGYVRAAVGSAVLICDCGPIGARYLPGHAHADTLSFELSLFGDRIVVNSGTSQYGVDAERHRQRGTPAHNTVAVDDADSSEVWAGFRVARRADAELCSATATDEHCQIEATHDGYMRLSGRNRHRRTWRLDPSSLQIEDQVSGSFHDARAYLHLHPRLLAQKTDQNLVTLSWGVRSASMEFIGARGVEVKAGTWHPRFGVSEPNQCIIASLSNNPLQTRVRWSNP